MSKTRSGQANIEKFQIMYQYNVLHLFLKNYEVHEHDHVVLHCNATLKAKRIFKINYEKTRDWTVDKEVDREGSNYSRCYLKHKVLNLRKVQVSCHHSGQQADIPSNFRSYPRISCQRITFI